MEEAVKLLERVIYTLNQVEVRGEDNMDKVLGCTRAVRQAVGMLRMDEQCGERESQEGQA